MNAETSAGLPDPSPVRSRRLGGRRTSAGGSTVTKKDLVTRIADKTGETKECVFVVDGGKAKLRAVKSGISDETSVAVLEGLKDGETVVTGPYRGLRDLKNGDAVKEKKAEERKDADGGAKAEVRVD